MKDIRKKHEIIRFSKELDTFKFPFNVYIGITVSSHQFDELVVSGLGRAIDIDTIQYEHDGKLFKVFRDTSTNELDKIKNDFDVFL